MRQTNAWFLAKEVEKKFDDLMMLTGRILEVSLVAKGSHEDQLKKAGNILAMIAHFQIIYTDIYS